MTHNYKPGKTCMEGLHNWWESWIDASKEKAACKAVELTYWDVSVERIWVLSRYAQTYHIAQYKLVSQVIKCADIWNKLCAETSFSHLGWQDRELIQKTTFPHCLNGKWCIPTLTAIISLHFHTIFCNPKVVWHPHHVTTNCLVIDVIVCS